MTVSGGTVLRLVVDDTWPTVTGVTFPEPDPIDAIGDVGFDGFSGNNFTFGGDTRIFVSGTMDGGTTWPVIDGIAAYVIDGVVTVNHHETFTDNDGDGIPEPTDGNGQWDWGEPYTDGNGNGQYDPLIVLTIDPGVRVESVLRESSYSRYIRVEGQLNATGVTFASFYAGSNDYNIIYYDDNTSDDPSDDSSGTLTNCTFEASDGGSEPILLVESNNVRVNGGFLLQASVQSGFLRASGTAFLGGGKGLRLSGTGQAVAYLCGFIGQSDYGVENTGSGIVDARWCWWDSTSGPSGAGTGTGTAVSAGVLYDPWLTSAPAAWEDQCQYGEDVPSVEVELARLWVWDDGTGRFVDPGGPISLLVNEPTYILAHGWDGNLADASHPAMSSVGCAIAEAAPSANILAWDWAGSANPDGDPNTINTLDILRSLVDHPWFVRYTSQVWLDAFRSGLNAATQGNILGEALAGQLQLHGSLGSELHLIGHSHGGGVVGRAAQKMSQLGYPADSVTTLDTPQLPALLINTARHTVPSSVERAAVFYYPWGCIGFGGHAASGATEVLLSCAHKPLFKDGHRWISGPDDASQCPTSEGWYPPGVWNPGSGLGSVYFNGQPKSLLDPGGFPTGVFQESDSSVYQFTTGRLDVAARELSRTETDAMSLRLEEPFDSANLWSGSNALLVDGADPDDPANRVVLMQEVGEASFFADIEWQADVVALTFDYMFLEPRGDESLTVYVNDQIVHFDAASTTLAIGHLSTSTLVYLGDVAGTTARLNFVLRTDGEPGGGLLIDNIRVYGLREGDLDGDGDIGASDFSQFSACMTAPGGSPGAGCVDADLDGDGDVDLRDLCFMQQTYTGEMQ